MTITGGFGWTMDLQRGSSRQWVMGRDGIKRWADNGEPVDGPHPPSRHCGCDDCAPSFEPDDTPDGVGSK